MDRFLVIPDLQLPFEAIDALPFALRVQKEYKIPKENILCVGDETDHYFGSMYKKSLNQNLSALDELKITKKKLKEWYRAFPICRLAISNHGLRWAKKAFEAEIPEIMLRPYQELIEAPAGWKWAMEWRINSRHPFRMIHGMGYSGANGARNAAVDAKTSTIIGHLHAHAGIFHIQTQGMEHPIWAMNTGCLIDVESFAFEYGKYCRNQPILGIGVVVDEGKTPIFVPFE